MKKFLAWMTASLLVQITLAAAAIAWVCIVATGTRDPLNVGDFCDTASGAQLRDPDGDNFGAVCDADFNQDCHVTMADYGIFRANWGLPTPPAGTGNANVDLDGNGGISLSDLPIFTGLFGRPPDTP